MKRINLVLFVILLISIAVMVVRGSRRLPAEKALFQLWNLTSTSWPEGAEEISISADGRKMTCRPEQLPTLTKIRRFLSEHLVRSDDPRINYRGRSDLMPCGELTIQCHGNANPFRILRLAAHPQFFALEMPVPGESSAGSLMFLERLEDLFTQIDYPSPPTF
jgi:hypothetical protein